MSQNEFQIGDVVKLKVNTQEFVVSNVKDHMIECVMWDGVSCKVITLPMLNHRLFVKVEQGY